MWNMSTTCRKHFLLITVPAFGHIVPLLELAKKISEHDSQHLITVVVSQSKIAEINTRQLLPAEYQQKIQLLGLDDKLDNSVTGVPGLPTVLKVIEEMKSPLLQLLGNLPNIPGQYPPAPVTVVIVEQYLTSVVTPLCHDLGVPCYVFHSSSGLSVTSAMHVSGKTSIIQSEASDVAGNNGNSVERTFVSVITETLNLAKGFIINTFLELDPDTVSDLREHPKLAGIPVWFVGPLFAAENNISSTIAQQISKWLDKQEERSVVYVSFGSLAGLKAEQLRELLNALLALNKPFIWSLPEKDQSELREILHSAVPDELNHSKYVPWFNAESDKFLILRWAPQKTILAHAATKVFVTHCGWNSVLESVTCGVPMVGWPMFGDQHQNGKWMESRKIASVIQDTHIASSRIVSASEIQTAISAVGGWAGDEQVPFFTNIQNLAKMATGALTKEGNSTQDFMDMINYDSRPKISNTKQ